MENTPCLETLEEIEKTCVPGFTEVFREEGLDAARYALFDTTGWHVDYDLCIWRSRSAKEQKRIGWAMAGILILTAVVL